MRNKWGLVLILAAVVISAKIKSCSNSEAEVGVSFEEYALEVCPDMRQMFYTQRQSLYQGEFDNCMSEKNSVGYCTSYIQHDVMPYALKYDSYALEKMGCGFKL